MCRQAGKLIKSLDLPPRVREISQRYPYLTSLACAQGMFHIYDAKTPSLPFHKDKPLLSGINSCKHLLLDFDNSIEPYPLSAFYAYSPYWAEIGFFYGLGMIYESDLLDKTSNLERLYKIMIQEYIKISSESKPAKSLLSDLNLNDYEANILMDFIEQERRFHYCTIGHIPDIISEKHNIINFLIKNCRQITR